MQKRKYNALSRVPWQVRADISKRIEDMPECNDKVICSLYFVSNLSPSEIIVYCAENDIRSRNNTFYTTRSIQNICYKHFPEVRQYRKPNPDRKKRKDHFQFLKDNEKTPCMLCGSTKHIEWHHIIPLFSGGETTQDNMVCLCRKCHKTIHAYHTRVSKRL